MGLIGYAAVSTGGDPADEFFDLTSAISDTVDLPNYGGYRAIYIGVGGSIKVNDKNNNTVTFQNAGPGYLAIRPRRIFATGTTAGAIIGVR